MKTMTCQQLGGPCDLGHRGQSADEVIKAQDKHLRAAVKAGDETHRPARQEMRSRWMHPKQSLGWYNDVKSAFAELPEDCPGPSDGAGSSGAADAGAPLPRGSRHDRGPTWVPRPRHASAARPIPRPWRSGARSCAVDRCGTQNCMRPSRRRERCSSRRSPVSASPTSREAGSIPR